MAEFEHGLRRAESVEGERAGLLLVGFLKAANPNTVLRYETNPHHPFDHTLWPILRPVMHAFASGKVTHWWHWHKLPNGIRIMDGVLLEGNPQALRTEVGSSLERTIRNVQMSLGGWQDAFVVGPADQQANKDGWRFAFERKGEVDRLSRFCSIISHSPIRILQRPEDFVVTGFGRDNFKEIPLDRVGPFPRRAVLPIF